MFRLDSLRNIDSVDWPSTSRSLTDMSEFELGQISPPISLDKKVTADPSIE
jgi:hypothetical protein